MADEIINRVAESSLKQIDLEDFLPKSEIIAYDLADNLYEGMMLKEKDFREFIANHDWSRYKDKVVAVHCSADAIVPNWAYMLLSAALFGNSVACHFGSEHEVREQLLLQNFKNSNLNFYKNGKVLVKGCGSFELSPAVYLEVTQILRPLVKSLMFGEACSSVPVFKSSN